MRRNHLFLHFPLSHLQYTKYFIDDFLHEQLLHLPIEHEQLSIIGLMLSVTSSSWPLWSEWTVREWFPTPFNWVRYVGFNFTGFPKVASLDPCSFCILKDSRRKWNEHPKVYIRHRSKMICPSCFGRCLFW